MGNLDYGRSMTSAGVRRGHALAWLIIIMQVAGGLSGSAERCRSSPAFRVAAKKQGPHAFENAAAEAAEGDLSNEGLRILVHACQDETMLRKYFPQVKAFLLFALDRGATFNEVSEVDFTLCRYLDRGLYVEQKSYDWCSGVFFGFLAFFPEYDRRLPLAHRAWKSWERQHVGGEGQPIPAEAIFLIADVMREQGQKLEALIVETSLDVYFRIGEWDQLRREDIIDDGENVGFVLGVAERGERTKTGVNKGVILDSLALRDEWRRRRAELRPGQSVVPFTPDDFRQRWKAAARLVGLSWVGPPHDLRHSGAARDVEGKHRSLEQVRRRGRWKTLESVQRYTKTWMLVRARGRLTTDQLERGQKLIAVRGQRRLVEPDRTRTGSAALSTALVRERLLENVKTTQRSTTADQHTRYRFIVLVPRSTSR